MSRAAIVTGAGRRIGRAIALALAEDGWAVALHYHRSRDEAEALRAEIEVAGGTAVTIGTDLADTAAVERLVPDCAAALSVAPTLLVNNASLFAYDKPATVTAESFLDHLKINTLAPILLSRGLVDQLPDGANGLIVNLLDYKIFNLNPDFFSYTVSKLALHGVSELLTLAEAPRVRVAGIAPSVALLSGRQTPESFARAQRHNLLERGVTVPEIVAALRFIIATPSLTGQTLVLDSGQSKIRQTRDVAFLTGTPDHDGD